LPFLRNFHYQVNTEIDFGPGIVTRLASIAKRYSNRVFLATMTYIPAVPRILDLMKDAGLEVASFDMIPVNPRIETMERAAAVARDGGCGVFMGLGGGSSMDTAKTAALMMNNPGPLWEYSVAMGEKMRPIQGEVPPIIAVPTTAGTGSEVSQSASLTNPDTCQKSPIRSPKIAPRHAVIDPELTVSLPRNLTASTGFEAFCLSFEKFLAAESFPFVDAMAEEAMRGVVRYLQKAMDDPKNLEARAVMMWESTQGGLCDLAGLGGIGLHAFSLPLSALLDLPRGESLALCMPIVLPEFARVRPDKVARLARVFAENDEEVPFLSNKEACDLVIRRMGEWLKKIGLAGKLGQHGVKTATIRELAASIEVERLKRSWGRSVTRAEVEDLYSRNL
jgi:alcohol dehydrogenase